MKDVISIKRTEFLFFYISDDEFIDIPSLLSGKIKFTPLKQIFAISILNGEEYPIPLDEISILFSIPQYWISIDSFVEDNEISRSLIMDFAKKGFIICTITDDHFIKLKNKDEILSSSQWNKFSAFYHFMTKWKDIDIKLEIPSIKEDSKEIQFIDKETFKEFVEKYGKPPSHFYSIKSHNNLSLPIVSHKNYFYEVLKKRHTVRLFDTQQPITIEELSNILHNVYGYHGYSVIYEDIIGLKKTSPSGGDLHPIETYLLVIDVIGIDSGIYHYNIQNHSLEEIETINKNTCQALAKEFTAGQKYTSSASVLFIMTARFYRNFWKYRRHDKAYSVLLMDAAHLSQTFYLVSTEMGLGPFVTAAINSINIEKKLKINGYDEGVLLLCGCGRPMKFS